MVDILDNLAAGRARKEDVDLLVDVSNNMMGNTICAFADGTAMPMLGFVRQFREEFVAAAKGGASRQPARPRGHRVARGCAVSTMGELLFVICAVIAVAGAVGTVAFQNPLRAAMSLLVHIIALSGIFLTLHAHLLAALQLLVYAGAVVVLFVFVIMLLGPESVTPPGELRGLLTRTAAAAVTAIVLGGIAFTLVKQSAPYVPIPGCENGAAECGQFGGVDGLGNAIFGGGIVPFELVSILLTVAIVGAIAIARGRSAAELAGCRKHEADEETARAADLARDKKLSAEVSAHGGHG